MISFILFIASKILNMEIKKRRLAFSGAVGSFIFCLFIYFNKLYLIYNFFYSLSIILICIQIYFKPKNLFQFLKYMLITLISSFAVGGVSFALYYYTNFYKVFGITGEGIKNNFSIKIMIITTSICYIFIKLYNHFLKKSLQNSELYYNLKIIENGKKVDLKGFLDTGNTLVEPITKCNVIIIQYELIKKFLSNNIQDILNESFDITNVLINLDANDINKFKVIPFTSVGNKNDLLLGFKPEKILINIHGEEKELQNTMVGICNFKLSNEYEVLLNKNIKWEELKC